MTVELSVDGVKAVEVQPAVVQVPGGTVKTDSILEVLLEDERTVFICRHRNTDGTCTYNADNAKSVASHQKSHSDRVMAKRAREEADKAIAELAASKERKVQGGIKAAATRAANAAKEMSVPKPTADVSAIDNGLTAALDTIEAVAEQLEVGIKDLDKAVLNLRTDIARLKNTTAAPDPKLVEKAAKYDALKGILG